MASWAQQGIDALLALKTAAEAALAHGAPSIEPQLLPSTSTGSAMPP